MQQPAGTLPTRRSGISRRDLLTWGGKALLGLTLMRSGLALGQNGEAGPGGHDDNAPLLLFLAGDVMPGRGIDQVLPNSADPVLHEPFVKNARTYVELAEAENGEIPEPVAFDYPWGEGLDVLADLNPDLRIVNLETAVTTSDDWWQGKSIHYRMHPANLPFLTAAALDACVLGNNHVLDWGRPGLRETLTTLEGAGIAAPGAGREIAEASAPAALPHPAGRLLLFSYGTPGAGVPLEWRAGEERAGVNVLPELSDRQVGAVAEEIESHRRPGDRVVVSLHWGGNWGYDVPPEQRDFARGLIDAGSADVVHGHSSHHPKGIEVYRGRPIIYGAGDLLNDYEGIGGHEDFRSELTLMYFPRLDPSGVLMSLEMAPMRVRRFRLERVGSEEARWLAERLDRESRRFGTGVELTAEGRLRVRWNQ